MKITLRNIRDRQMEIRRIVGSRKTTPKAVKKANALLRHHKELLQKEIESAQPFIAMYSEHEHLIDCYYIKLWSKVKYAAENDMSMTEVESELRTIERKAAKWYETH